MNDEPVTVISETRSEYYGRKWREEHRFLSCFIQLLMVILILACLVAVWTSH